MDDEERTRFSQPASGGQSLRSLIRSLVPPLLLGWWRRVRSRRTDTGDDWRAAVGGRWEELGKLQCDFLISRGLRPEHKLLDVGCGALRGGVHFMRYLNKGNYYGVEAQQWLLDRGRDVELPKAGLEAGAATLLCRDDFDVSELGVSFDYAIAQSVFTHLPWNAIQRCLANATRFLAPEGQFYATFFEDPDGSHLTGPLVQQPGGPITYPDRDCYHYAFEVFVSLAGRLALEVEYIGEWGHPRGQRMMAFRRARTS